MSHRWSTQRAAVCALASLGASCWFASCTEPAPPDDESEVAAPTVEPRYLTYKGRLGTEDAAQHYKNKLGTYPSFDAWKQAHCIYEDTESLTYFNKVDLAFGRRLRWADCGGRISACVDNYGTPGQTEVEGLHALQFGTNIAVCMDHDPSRGPGFEVQFYIYRDDAPRISLPFDRQGEKLSPYACSACHGGKLVELDDAGNAVYLVKGAQFLPLLMESITFDHPTIAFEEDRIREWNEQVYTTSTSAGIRMVLDAAYPGPAPGAGVATLGTSYLRDQVPPEWQPHEEYYRVLLFPNCMTCHVAHPEPVFDPDNAALNKLIQNVVCRTREMPNSIEGQKRFGSPFHEAHLAGCL